MNNNKKNKVNGKNIKRSRRNIKRIAKILSFIIAAFIVYSVLVILFFKWINPPTSAFIQSNYYPEFSNIFSGDVAIVKWTPLNRISKQMILAVIASEDQKFPTHFGFDIEEIEKAIEDKFKGKRLRGASTITQQVAKNLFLWPAKDFLRKGMESYYTILLEIFWSKKRIIETYLNIAEFGNDVYGAETAAQKYFHKPASRLSEYEAALLAAVLPNPKKFKIENPGAYLRERQKEIIKQMKQLGGVTYIKKFINH